MKVKEFVSIMRLYEIMEIREENHFACLCDSKDRVIELFGDRIIIDFFTTANRVMDVGGLKRIVINIKESEKE